MARPIPLPLLVCALLPVLLPAQEPETDPPKPPTREDAASGKVDIKKECRLLEEIFRRRLAFHFLAEDEDARGKILKTLDPQSASGIKRLLESDRRSKELDYHYLERIHNAERRILNRLRKDAFRSVQDLLEVVSEKEFPLSAAYANLLNTVDLNFRYARRKSLIDDEHLLEEVAPQLTSQRVRVNGTAGHGLKDLAAELWKKKKPDAFPAWWFDRGSGPISYPFGPVPEVEDFPLVDLNTASKKELAALPFLEKEAADAVLEYRSRQGFQGPEELRLVEAVPRHLVEPLQSLCRASHLVKHKKWTVIVYLNAANNLEPFGIEDINEMEKVGSTRDVNVVVECARFYGRPEKVVNREYFRNPYADRERVYYFGLDNVPGTRRYYILKDDDDVRVRSVLKANVGKTDAGRPGPLAEFGRWAVEKYPADHYALVIWNHGAGWSGVSHDSNTHHGMDLPDVRRACEAICEAVKKQGGERIDIVDFDACLMATLEVAYELKDVADYLVASQELEPGDGMPYDDYLRWMVTWPEAAPLSVSKAMVDAYVRSYAPEGSQTGKRGWRGSETKSAIRLKQAGRLRDAVEEMAGILLEKPGLLGDVAEEVVREARNFGRLVDVQDLFERLLEHDEDDKKLAAAVERVREIIGYPQEEEDVLVNEVVIRRRSPGSVIWGFNGWAAPPRSLAPFVHKARLARTPLVGPDEKGDYVAEIEFPPQLKNPRTGKRELVKEINYRFSDESKKRTISDFENTFITTRFPEDSVVCAEGHLVGNNRSHGISIYFPAYLGYEKDYDRLRFARDSLWARLCARFPLEEPGDPKEVALLGLNHVTRKDREKLGGIVVKEAFKEAVREHDFAGLLKGDLEALELETAAVQDPRPYGMDWEELLAAWRSSVVVLDNHDGLPDSLPRMRRGRPPRYGGPGGRAVLRHLLAGGRILLSSPDVTRRLWDQPLYREALGLTYARTWNRSYDLRLLLAGSGEEHEVTVVPARKGRFLTVFQGGDGVEPLALLAGDGGMVGARIARTHPQSGKPVRAVVLGFHLTDIQEQDDRRLLLKSALDFLRTTPPATPVAGSAPDPTEPPDLAPEAPDPGDGGG